MAEREQQDLTLEGLIHDLNNVFQTILDAADILGEQERWRPLAGAIQRSVDRGQRLVSGFRQASEAACDFAMIAESAMQFARDFLQASHGPEIDFRSRIEDGLRLGGKPVAWERVLVNLLLNSAQAMPKGGAVTLEAARCGDVICVSVADEGPGIPQGILERIFDPHFSTKPASSGLGLHIVRSIVEQNGGAVAARNRGEGGAEFTIRLHAPVT
ncbi:MAG: HAMP domain-containing histidine kinase [Acidobacteria bacterium]|nr:HAMP domain-containing histidine kinase [Acidobacteriota bacterium]